MAITHPAVLVMLGALALAAPTHARAQHAEGEERPTSQWQFGVRAVDWEVVEGLQDEVRGYREAGAIGAYELLIRTNGARFDALLTAVIVDATRLAELRDLDVLGMTPEAADSGMRRDERPS
jgi:hypothetical protein